MRKLSTEKRAAILSALVEGNSIASVCRMLGANKVTVLRLLADAGTFAARLHDEFVNELESKRVQIDEAWAFCGCKAKAKARGASGHGDVWTWAAIDADSKLCISYLVGGRDSANAQAFVMDVADRLATRIQLTTDGLNAYLEAVERAFGGDVDYAQLIKVYAADRQSGQIRYSPPECVDCKRSRIAGDPDPKHINTSFVERQNLTLRMGSRRFTRLTNAFSKRVQNHAHAVALHYMHYNFIRKHMTLKTTPAAAAGVSDCEWTMLDFVKMMEQEESHKGGRLTNYKPSSKGK